MRGPVSTVLLAAMAMACHAAEPPPGTSLAFMGGHWCGTDDGAQVEEFWLPPRGGELHGLSRTVRDGRVVGFEFLRIALQDGVPVYLAQPHGRAPVAFKRVASGAQWARFENQAHDFPQRIEYRREGAAVHATVSGPGSDGTDVSIRYDYVACVK